MRAFASRVLMMAMLLASWLEPATSKMLWSLDAKSSDDLIAKRRSPFRNAKFEHLKQPRVFQMQRSVLKSLKSGDKVSFDVPMKSGSVEGRGVNPVEARSCVLKEGIPGISKRGRELNPDLRMFSCVPKGLEEFHLIINTGESGEVFGNFFDERGNSFYIDPAFEGDHQSFMMYNSKTLLNEAPEEARNYSNTVDFIDKIESDSDPSMEEKNRSLQTSGVLKSYMFKIVILVSPEVAADMGNSESGAATALAAIISRTNGIYSREVGVFFELVDNFRHAICLSTSPSPCTEVINSIGQRQFNLEHLTALGIPPESYDVGHSFHENGGGGLANIDALCSSNDLVKAAGASDFMPRAFKTVDSFVVNMFAHELGHQVGAFHSFRYCTSNQNAITERSAVEPGSGSTIMSYAGVCGGSTNLQTKSDPYFNNFTQKKMKLNIERIVNQKENCGSLVEIPRELSEITTPSTCTIPIGNNFILKGATSSSGNTGKFYSWDRVDPGSEDFKNMTLGRFRSYKPFVSKERFFPNLHFLNFGIYDRAEVLPLIERPMTFRFTERRHFLANGELDSFDQTVMGDFASSDTVVEFKDVGPLAITNLENDIELPLDEPFLVKWNSGGLASISTTAKVEVLFAENTMTPIEELIKFDYEVDNKVLGWKLLKETSLSAKSSCISIDGFDTSSVSGLKGNLMIRISTSDSSNFDTACYAFDIITGITLTKSSRRLRGLVTTCDPRESTLSYYDGIINTTFPIPFGN